MSLSLLPPNLETSCDPNLPYPPLRFSPSYSDSQISAYPPARPRDHIIVIKTSTPALISYVLGPNWQSQIRNNTSWSIYLDKMPNTRGYNDRYIVEMAQTLQRLKDDGVVQPLLPDSEEIALAMRILRAGGAVLDLSGCPWPEDREGKEQSEYSAFKESREYIFGWPDTGGVWALKLIPRPVISLEEEEMAMEGEGAITLEEYMVMLTGPLDFRKLEKTENMMAYCAELRHLGAVFYEHPEDCEDVVMGGLLNTTSLGMDWRRILDPSLGNVSAHGKEGMGREGGECWYEEDEYEEDEDEDEDLVCTYPWWKFWKG
ncbi:hypothetical protein P154DRAFT_525456 [Amniculicola lignicola CBS 123094]|uniref:Uncharacterized protein n=1 Tax=Amniculicola lignicola CBS 123094 TaxID=1392246 RepID=A0A6A5WG49_9PLEO|nr:hypothetical protein P154DRAFT_525456 [Amniculicola lignicola CBS 123094]